MHIGQDPLDDACAAATRRPIGDAWAWGRKASGSDISPMVAVTIAHAGAAATPPRATIRIHRPPTTATTSEPQTGHIAGAAGRAGVT